jgi:uncharacterized protein YndB with AHSA1/START domain
MTEISPVEVTMHIPAAPEDVFPYFTDPARYVQWMGSEAKLEPVPGGVYRVQMPDGFAAAGEFVEVTQPYRVVFSWGFANDEAAKRTKHKPGEATSGSAMPPGSTRVTVTLEDEDGGSRLTPTCPGSPSGPRVATRAPTRTPRARKTRCLNGRQTA